MAPPTSSPAPVDIPVYPSEKELLPEIPRPSPLDSASLVAFIIIAVFLVLFITYMAVRVGRLLVSKLDGSGGCCRSRRPKIPKDSFPCITVPVQPPPPWVLAYKVYQESPTTSEASSDLEPGKAEAAYPRGLCIFVEETCGSEGKDTVIRRSEIPTVTLGTIRSSANQEGSQSIAQR